MKRYWLIATIAIVGLALLALSWRRNRPVGSARGATAEELAQELQSLKHQVNRLQAPAGPQVYVVAQPATTGSEAPTPPKSEAPPPAAEPALSPEERLQQTATDLDVRLASEKIDSAWSVTMTHQIRDAVSSNAPGARVVQADCGTTVCRVVLTHDSPEDQKSIGEALATAEPFREGVFYHYDENATSPKTTLYVIREGHSFRDDL